MTSTVHLAKVSSRCLAKMTFRYAFKTPFGHLQDVLARRLACLNKISLRHLLDVFLPTGNTCLKGSQDPRKLLRLRTFVTIIKGFKPPTTVAKLSILDVCKGSG